MEHKLSGHAEEEIARRGISHALVEEVLEAPDQIVPERGRLKAYQSRREIGGKIFLVRVIVDDSKEPPLVVTAYRTSKMERYWEKP